MYVPLQVLIHPIQLGVTFSHAVSKLKAQSSNFSFHWNVAKETFELWALSFRKWHPKWDWLWIDLEKVLYSSCSTNIQNHVLEIFVLQNLILRKRSCGTGIITQSSCVFHFHLTTLVCWKCFVPLLYQFRRGMSGARALNYFYMIHRGGRTWRMPAFWCISTKFCVDLYRYQVCSILFFLSITHVHPPSPSKFTLWFTGFSSIHVS